LSKESITQELLEIKEGGACDFAKGNNCKGWRGGYGENIFFKSKNIKFNEDCPLVISFCFFRKIAKCQILISKWQNLGVLWVFK